MLLKYARKSMVSANLMGILYPSVDGTTGQVLATDGAGNLGFVTVSAPVTSSSTGANLSVNEVITANWDNSANPWSDAEVADALTITGGSINGSPIGATTVSTGAFSTLQAQSLSAPTGSINTLQAQALMVSGSSNLGGLVLPITTGANGQVLSSMGNGGMNWVTPVSDLDVNLNNVNVANARLNLGLVIGDNVMAHDGAMVTAGNAVSNLLVTGGSISGTPISGSSGNFTELSAGNLTVAGNIEALGALVVTGSTNLGGLLLPSANGSVGQVLSDDGNGNLNWSSPVDASLSNVNPVVVRQNLGLVIGDNVMAHDGAMVTAGNAVNNLVVTGGSISGTPISGSSGNFTELSAGNLTVGGNIEALGSLVVSGSTNLI